MPWEEPRYPGFDGGLGKFALSARSGCEADATDDGVVPAHDGRQFSDGGNGDVSLLDGDVLGVQVIGSACCLCSRTAQDREGAQVCCAVLSLSERAEQARAEFACTDDEDALAGCSGL